MKDCFFVLYHTKIDTCALFSKLRFRVSSKTSFRVSTSIGNYIINLVGNCTAPIFSISMFLSFPFETKTKL